MVLPVVSSSLFVEDTNLFWTNDELDILVNAIY